jgi:iron(III) transport system substrate-binding protein
VPAISRTVTACVGVLLILVSMALVACSEDSTLVVYSGRSESLVEPVVELFRESTGIAVDVKYGSTAEIAATLLEEGKNSPADVFFAQDPGGLGAVVDMLSTLSAEILAPVPSWARSPNGDWVGVSGRARVVAYNTDEVDPSEMPDTMEGFTDPRWKGRIGWPPSNGSFQAMVTAMRVQWGEEPTRKWLKGIIANEPVAYPKNTPTVAAAATGEVAVGFVNHYYLHRFLQEEGEGFGARNHYLTGGGPGSVVLVAGAGILETTENRDDAEKFTKFLLSTVAQQYFSAQTFEYPLVDGVSIDSALQPLSGLQNPDVDMASLTDLKGTQALLRDLGIIP